MAEQTAAIVYAEQIQDAALSIPELLMRDLEQSFVWRVNFVPGDPYTSALMEGEKKVVVHLRQLRQLAQARRRG